MLSYLALVSPTRSPFDSAQGSLFLLPIYDTAPTAQVVAIELRAFSFQLPLSEELLTLISAIKNQRKSAKSA